MGSGITGKGATGNPGGAGNFAVRNANGVESSSPGLRGTSYPGSQSISMQTTLKGLHPARDTDDSTPAGLMFF